MGQFRKKLIIMTAAGALAVSSLAGCSRSMDNDAVVAEVGKDKITLGVANFYARMHQAQYETYYAGMMGMTGEDMWKQEVEDGKTYEDGMKESLLEALENMYLLNQHAADYDIELTDDDKKAIDKAANLFVEDNTLEDKEAVSGYEKNVKKYLELATIQSRMDQPMKEGVDEEVSDEEAAQKSMQYVLFSYNKTDADGKSEAMTDDEKAAQKQKAQEFADSLKAGDNPDIGALAQEAGQEVKTATFDADSTSPNADLVKAADALENEGDVTDIVDTDSGIYVAKVTSFLDREATDAKKESIVEERKQEQYDSLLKKWREDTEITEHKNVWKKVNFEKQGVTVKQSEDDYSDNE